MFYSISLSSKNNYITFLIMTQKYTPHNIYSQFDNHRLDIVAINNFISGYKIYSDICLFISCVIIVCTV